jgi:hypothetical protein
LRHRTGVIAAFQKFFALEQRARTGRRAARNEQGKRQEKQKTKMENGAPPKSSILHLPSSTLALRIFYGQHRRWW